MATGKAVNLRVRPVQSIDLSYPVDGVISKQAPVLLGDVYQNIDVEVLYNRLGETVEGDVSRLAWNSTRIRDYLFNVAGEAAGPGATMLSQLRNVPEASDLDAAINMRQNAYLTSYSPEVIEVVKRIYYQNPRDDSAARYKLLAAAEADVVQMHAGLAQAYGNHGWNNKVVESAHSQYDNKGTQYSGSGHVQFEGISDTESWGYEFRHPVAENDLRYHQSRAALRQEYLQAWRMEEMCRFDTTTFANELNAMDLQIQKLQAAYIDTFLFSSVGGTVTAVFHSQGDYVRAGEPVVRVETDEPIYLVGTIKYRGMVRLGSTVTVTTTLFEAEGATPTTVSGQVVAVRSHDSISEQWDLLIICANQSSTGQSILPLNYNFDFEATTVDVTTV